mgnify:CR=1 FL=1
MFHVFQYGGRGGGGSLGIFAVLTACVSGGRAAVSLQGEFGA